MWTAPGTRTIAGPLTVLGMRYWTYIWPVLICPAGIGPVPDRAGMGRLERPPADEEAAEVLQLQRAAKRAGGRGGDGRQQ